MTRYDIHRLQHHIQSLARWGAVAVLVAGFSITHAQTSYQLSSKQTLTELEQSYYDRLYTEWQQTPDGQRAVSKAQAQSNANLGRITAYKEIGQELDAQKNVALAGRGTLTVPDTNIKVPVDTKIKLSTQAVGKALARTAALYNVYTLGEDMVAIWGDAGLQLNPYGAVVDPTTGYTGEPYQPQSILPQSTTGWCISTSNAWGIQMNPNCGVSDVEVCQAWMAGVFTYSHVGWNGPRACFFQYNGTRSVNFTSSAPVAITVCPPNSTNITGVCVPNAGYQEFNGTIVPACVSGLVRHPSTGQCVSSELQQLTEQEIADRIAQQSGWPDSKIIGALNKAMSLPGVPDALVQHLSQNPPPLDVAVPVNGSPLTSGSFDATAPRVTTETTTNPDGSSVEKTTTEKITGTVNPTTDTVKFERQTVTSSQPKDPQGQPVGSPTVSTSVASANGTNPGAVDGTQTEEKNILESFCEKFPNIIGCSEWGKPEDLDQEIPERTENIEFQPENLGLGGGSCPAPFGWTDSLGTHQIDLQPYCDVIESIVKPLVLAFALLAAMFIVAPIRDTQ